MRTLRVARRPAVKARTRAASQIRDLIVTAPDDLRAQLSELGTSARVRVCARFRPGQVSDPAEAARRTLCCLARRHQPLTAGIDEPGQPIGQLCAQAGPALLAARGAGPEVAPVLLIAAGDNPGRMRTEASLAALCGSSPVEASSGKVTRHRLNQGGNREANNALWPIAMIRLTCDQRTQDYAARRRSEGKSDREIIRCRKRHIAREVCQLITDPPAVPDRASLRAARTAAAISLATAAGQLSTWPARISELERGLKHDADLAGRYQQWLSQKTA